MKTILSNLTIVMLLSGLFSPNLYANNIPNESPATQTSAMKKAGAKDSALRRGTENWEQPQSDFFVVPGLILGLVAIILFYKRD